MSFRELIYFNKKKIMMIFSFIFVAGGCFVVYYFYNTGDESKLNNIKMEEVEKKEEVVVNKVEEEAVINCYFDIKGEVKKPGVYSIDCNKRIVDAIEISGGLTKNSDTSVLNLSKKINDGMVIIVYSKNEVENYVNILKTNEYKASICNNSNINNDACDDNTNVTTDNNALININTASVEELMTLPGIGEAKAKNIISYREKSLFKSIEELKQVEGIGESLYVTIKENITV